MDQTKYKLILTIYLLFSSLFIAEIYSESALRSLYDVLGKLPEQDITSHTFVKNHKQVDLPVADQSNCNLQKTGSLSSVSYFGINCEGNLRDGLISFSHLRTEKKITAGYFRILGREKIGKKNYLKILYNPNKSKIADSLSYTEDTEFNYEKKNPSKKLSVKKNIIPKVSETNANLTYFKIIAFDKNRRKEAPSGLEIFFDHTCPLKFKEIDESFYWDNTISYVFEISCVKNSPYVLLRVPGNKRNKLVASNLETQTPEKGDSFLARLKLRKITNEQAYWEDFKIYYE